MVTADAHRAVQAFRLERMGADGTAPSRLCRGEKGPFEGEGQQLAGHAITAFVSEDHRMGDFPGPRAPRLTRLASIEGMDYL